MMAIKKVSLVGDVCLCHVKWNTPCFGNTTPCSCRPLVVPTPPVKLAVPTPSGSLLILHPAIWPICIWTRTRRSARPRSSSWARRRRWEGERLESEDESNEHGKRHLDILLSKILSDTRTMRWVRDSGGGTLSGPDCKKTGVGYFLLHDVRPNVNNGAAQTNIGEIEAARRGKLSCSA